MDTTNLITQRHSKKGRRRLTHSFLPDQTWIRKRMAIERTNILNSIHEQRGDELSRKERESQNPMGDQTEAGGARRCFVVDGGE